MLHGGASSATSPNRLDGAQALATMAASSRKERLAAASALRRGSVPPPPPKAAAAARSTRPTGAKTPERTASPRGDQKTPRRGTAQTAPVKTPPKGGKTPTKSPSRTPKQAASPARTAGTPARGQRTPAGTPATPRSAKRTRDAEDIETPTALTSGKKQRAMFESKEEETKWDTDAQKWQASFNKYIADVDSIEL